MKEVNWSQGRIKGMYKGLCKSDPNYRILFAPYVQSLGSHGAPDQMQLLLNVRELLAAQAWSSKPCVRIDF